MTISALAARTSVRRPLDPPHPCDAIDQQFRHLAASDCLRHRNRLIELGLPDLAVPFERRLCRLLHATCTAFLGPTCPRWIPYADHPAPPPRVFLRIEIFHPKIHRPHWLQEWDHNRIATRYCATPDDPNLDPAADLDAWGGYHFSGGWTEYFRDLNPTLVPVEIVDCQLGAGLDARVLPPRYGP